MSNSYLRNARTDVRYGLRYGYPWCCISNFLLRTLAMQWCRSYHAYDGQALSGNKFWMLIFNFLTPRDSYRRGWHYVPCPICYARQRSVSRNQLDL